MEGLNVHRDYLLKEKLLIKKINDRYKSQVNSLIINRFKSYFWDKDKKSKLLSNEIDKDIKDRISPSEFVDKITKDEQF